MDPGPLEPRHPPLDGGRGAMAGGGAAPGAPGDARHAAHKARGLAEELEA